MFDFIKNLFKNNKCCCKAECNFKFDGPDVKEYGDVVIIRRNYEITLPIDIDNKLNEENISISLTKYNNKPSCVQLFKKVNNKSKYIGTLKSYMNVKSFKDGNICNFSRDNLIFN